VLLRDARAAGSNVARADMRRLPFRPGAFDLVGCFFTSFGYFATFEEDVAALAGFARSVRPGGFLFIDLPNAAQVARALVPEDTADWNGRRVDVRRALEGDSVVKRIRIHAGAGAEELRREERVRLFTLDRLEPALRGLGLETARVYGDESGAEYDPELSPRMSLLLRCPA
jgi:SAM-dependent methyltransferase